MQARWGTHGDHEMIVLAPNSPQETYELTYRAFNLSEKLRHPVILLSDEVVGHSREKVVVNSSSINQISRRFGKQGDLPYGGIDSDGHAIMPKFGDGHNLLITGSTHDEQGFRKSSDSETHDKLIRRIVTKIRDAGPILDDFVISGQDTAEWGIISFGSTSRSVEELMITENVKPTLRAMRLKTVWPFPDQAIRDFSKTVDKILVPELNLGQMFREVSRVVRDTVEVIPLNKIGGGRMIEPHELLSTISQLQ
jgi:2-oxoglutarate ferredoxin oxidoreductase subunit alpha